MTSREKCEQINQAFINQYFPMNQIVARCGNELLFRDIQENLISVRVSYINKDRETKLIQYINDKAIALKEKEMAHNKNNKNT